MDPDLFITIAFSSFVFVVGIVGLILLTVMVVRSHRRAEGPTSKRSPRQRLPGRLSARPSGRPPGRVRAKSMVAPVDRESGRDGSEESRPVPGHSCWNRRFRRLERGAAVGNAAQREVIEMSTAQDRPGSGEVLHGGAVVVWSGDLKSGTGSLRFEYGAG